VLLVLMAPATGSEAIASVDFAAMLYGAAVAIPAAMLEHVSEAELAHRGIERAATLSH
jgi:hypothetical protein